MDWNRIKNQNIYDALYISDSEDSVNDELVLNPPNRRAKIPYLCDSYEKKIFCRKSYKNTINKYDNTILEKNIKLLEKSINKLCIDIRSDDKFLYPNKKPRNFGCGIYD